MERGEVVRWNFDRGFGFVKNDYDGKDVFAHISNVADDTLDELPIGTRVTFDTAEGRKPGTVEAKNVKIIEGNE